MNEIDFVVTWVDGNDPAWQAEKRKYDGASGDSSDTRYRDWDLLRYWFRGVEKYAPWVRKIHFVTWGHVPEWLDTGNPKLNIVKHTDFIPPQYLPTFNSHTIELNMHRIPGLAEQFVYFNDDMYITNATTPELFFKKGYPCATFGLEVIKHKKGGIGHILATDIAIINEHFFMRKVLKKNWKKVLSPVNGIKHVIRTGMLSLCTSYFPGLYDWHSAVSFNKSTFEEVWKEEDVILDNTCRCRFRQDINVSPYVFEYWQMATGKFAPRSEKYSKTYQLNDNNVDDMINTLRSGKYRIMCINDTEKLTDWEDAAQKTKEAFESIYSDKCSYEKSV